MSKSNRLSNAFPDRLRTAREARGMSQGKLAEKAGLQPSAVSHFETGTRKPSFDNLRRLADALRVSTDYLLGRTEDMEGSGAEVDMLNRQYAGLSDEYQNMADDFMKMLAEKAKAKQQTDK